jgi:hypothetical protein
VRSACFKMRAYEKIKNTSMEWLCNDYGWKANFDGEAAPIKKPTVPLFWTKFKQCVSLAMIVILVII